MITIINQINTKHIRDTLYHNIRGLFSFINFSLKVIIISYLAYTQIGMIGICLIIYEMYNIENLQNITKYY